MCIGNTYHRILSTDLKVGVKYSRLLLLGVKEFEYEKFV